MAVDRSRFDRLRQAAAKLASDAWADTDIEPQSGSEAVWAVTALGEAMDAQAGSKHQALLGQLDNADMLSSDPLQVLSELVQNADDAGASEVRFRLESDQLLVAHDGRAVRLRDLQFLALPGLSGKKNDPQATGRFGIGLSTIRSLTGTWEIHNWPFRVHVDGSTLRPARVFDASDLVEGHGWTVFRIPLVKQKVTAEDLDVWFGNWDASALLFLRSVRAVSVTTKGRSVRTLSLTAEHTGTLTARIGTQDTQVTIARVTSSDGAVWQVFQAELPTPVGLSRRHKSTAQTVPIGVALPHAPVPRGVVHSGLPVADLPAMARVNALFETLTNRQDFIGGGWNAEMCQLVAQLWAVATRHMLERVDPQAWHLIPVGSDGYPAGTTLPEGLTERLRLLGRTQIASNLRLSAAHRAHRSLAELAVEEAPLTGVVSDIDLAAVAGLPAVFPDRARDAAGRWRVVLADWRHSKRANLPKEVSVSEALVLLKRNDYPVEKVIKLSACAIDRHLGGQLRASPCLVASDGIRHTPPTAEQLSVVFNATTSATTRRDALPDALGIGITLNPIYYADTAEARTIRGWLRELDCLVDPGDAQALLLRIVAFGRSGGTLQPPGNDDVLRALLAAMRQLDDRTRRRIGLDIGNAVSLKAIRHTSSGEAAECLARPSQTYLSAQLDRRQRSFAEAAGNTAGLMWVSPDYLKILRSPGGDHDLSIADFLRLLGAADAPRTVDADFGDNKHYARDKRSGLPIYSSGSTPERNKVLDRTGASHTLNDRHSPDLEAVARSIAADEDGLRRRRRAIALLETLRRASMLTGTASKVSTATGNYGWNTMGQIQPLWAWRLRRIPWIDDSHGKAVRPDGLHHKTEAAAALYGTDDPGYLHPDFDTFAAKHADCLPILNIAGDPSRTQLLGRLRVLRKRSPNGPVPDHVRTEVHVVYRALAQTIAGGPGVVHPNLIPAREKLILTDQGWRQPSEALRGKSILAGYRPYVSADDQLAPLWQALRIAPPSALDVVEVLKIVAAKQQQPDIADQGVLLEGMRHLNELLESTVAGPVDLGLRNKLRHLPLWTRDGWSKQRPIYFTDNRDLTRRLSHLLAIWEPGGQLELGTALLDLLRVTKLDLTQATIIASVPSAADEDLTDRFRRIAVRFQDEIARFEPRAADAFTGWDWLTGLDVSVAPGLRVALPIPPQDITIRIDAHIDQPNGILYVDNEKALLLATGNAIAAYFSAEREHVAMRWTSMWEHPAAYEALGPAPMTTARQRDSKAQDQLAAQIAQRTQALPAVSTSTPARAQQTPAEPSPRPSPQRPTAPLSTETTAANPPRQLVNLASLALEAPGFQSISNHHTGSATGGSAHPDRRTRQLAVPQSGRAAPRQHLGPRAYTDLDRENLAFELLRAALHQQGLTLQDCRAQPGVGADAVASNGDFYEIKAHAGPEPDSESITLSELQRAYQQGHRFHLAIASNLEQGNGSPEIRIVTDPLRVLAVETKDSIQLYGLQKPDLPGLKIIFPERAG
ncbi:hypothetical protein HDA40_001976 [Hamadaea flava]|uniref:ATP-binding protein n=1 Tax=Hamadaea flava TaxID=1742688 RepID=A0ABV8M1A4_9ACTN|nr:ATP-binding protein [Hamadaea flava]MCP2323469.1 hypothetical protein [Hamadaea flava]